jgi:hypothetical protein
MAMETADTLSEVEIGNAPLYSALTSRRSGPALIWW